VKIIPQSATIDADGMTPYEATLRFLERLARNCYRSEHKISDDVEDAEKFLAKQIMGHGSATPRKQHLGVLEHILVTARITTNRGISHELVRHRISSILQSSTRYIDVSKDGDMEFVLSGDIDPSSEEFNDWKEACEVTEKIYRRMRARGCKPQIARDITVHALRTDIYMTANLREWRHVMDLRLDKAAHPDMRRLMAMLAAEMIQYYPLFFRDVVMPPCCETCTHHGNHVKTMHDPTCAKHGVFLKKDYWGQCVPHHPCLLNDPMMEGTPLAT
jgi:thymidylate synthase (FAD)